MAITLKNSWNVSPPRWGSPVDIQHAVKINAGCIYGINASNIKFILPLFWGTPYLDFSGIRNICTNKGTVYKNNVVVFDGVNDLIEVSDKSNFDFLQSSFSTKYTIIVVEKSNLDRGQFFSKSYQSGVQGFGVDFRINSDGKLGFIWGRNTLGFNDYWSWTTNNAVAGDNKWNTCAVIVNTSSSIIFNVNRNIKPNTKTTFGVGGQVGTTLAPVYIGARDGADSADQAWLAGKLKVVDVFEKALSTDQISLFNSLPCGLYQKVSNPFYLFVETAAGWTGKINTATNPAKINGIAVANITKVMGQ